MFESLTKTDNFFFRQFYDPTDCSSPKFSPGSLYTCNATRPSCKTYIVYRSHEGFHNISNISVLFDINKNKASELEIEAYPLLDELTSKISTLNLERVRRLKSRLVALTHRVQKVGDEIEQLMDDDGDMDEMYLTEKKRQTESFYGDRSLQEFNSTGQLVSVSASVSPVSSPPDSRAESRRLERALSLARSRHSSKKNSDGIQENIEELEMLLEAYFVVIDSTLNKLTSICSISLILISFYLLFLLLKLSKVPIVLFQLKEYIDDT